MVRAVCIKVEVKEVMAGVRMVARSMRMSKSRLEAGDLVSMSQAAQRTRTSVQD